MLNFIESLKFVYYIEEASDVIISIVVSYDDECNFELTNDQIKKLSKLNLPLGISCFKK